jgi:hypothetical protein
MAKPIDMMLEGATWTPIERAETPEGELYATHEGVLDLGALGTMKCWRLSNGQAVIDAQDMARFFGFDSPDALIADVETLNEALADKLRNPISFDRR